MLLISTSAFAEFKSLTEIEASLDPMEFLNNHDGVRRSVDLDIRFALASAAEPEWDLNGLGDPEVGGSAVGLPPPRLKEVRAACEQQESLTPRPPKAASRAAP